MVNTYNRTVLNKSVFQLYCPDRLDWIHLQQQKNADQTTLSIVTMIIKFNHSQAVCSVNYWLGSRVL